MRHRTVYGVYFSPTHTTQKITEEFTGGLSAGLQMDKTYVDLTLPAKRQQTLLKLDEEDILVLGFPVYAGRIPVFLEEVFRRIQGSGKTAAVIMGLYGNRDYDDALLEAAEIMAGQGFRVVAAGAFIGEHSLTKKVGTGRPDGRDIAKAAAFSRLVAEKLRCGDKTPATVKGNRPYKVRKPAVPVAPQTRSTCTSCGYCAQHCPMGIISLQDPFQVAQGCIHCCACVKGCPVQAKYFDQESIQKVIAMLETNCTARREPEFFI